MAIFKTVTLPDIVTTKADECEKLFEIMTKANNNNKLKVGRRITMAHSKNFNCNLDHVLSYVQLFYNYLELFRNGFV